MYTVPEVIKILRISRSTLDKMINKGYLPCGRTPGGPKRKGHRRFDEEAVEKARELLVSGEVIATQAHPTRRWQRKPRDLRVTTA